MNMWIGFSWLRTEEGNCEYDNEHLDSMKVKECFYQLSNYQILK
jgi:hypothetical protein